MNIRIIPVKTLFLIGIITGLLALWLFAVQQNVALGMRVGRTEKTLRELSLDTTELEAAYMQLSAEKRGVLIASGAFLMEEHPIFVRKSRALGLVVSSSKVPRGLLRE